MNYQQTNIDGTKTWCRFVGGIMDGFEDFVENAATWVNFPKPTLSGWRQITYCRSADDPTKFVPRKQ